MPQNIIVVGGDESRINEVLGYILAESLHIDCMTIAGGGFMGGEVVTYIVVNRDASGVKKRCDARYSFSDNATLTRLTQKLNAVQINQMEFDRQKAKLGTPIHINIIK